MASGYEPGRTVPLKGRQLAQQADFPKALELFTGGSGQRSSIGVRRAIGSRRSSNRSITEPQVSVSVQNIFLPDSEIHIS